MMIKEVVEKVRQTNKILFLNPEYKLRILASQKKFPNKFEKYFMKLLRRWKIKQFRFTGNRTFWIGPCKSGLARNPDFIDTINKKVILTCGRHWHTKESIQVQIDDYLDKGYKTLIVWDNEVNESKEKVLRFVLE